MTIHSLMKKSLGRHAMHPRSFRNREAWKQKEDKRNIFESKWKWDDEKGWLLRHMINLDDNVNQEQVADTWEGNIKK